MNPIVVLSNFTVRAEKYLIAALAAAITLLILLNVATRAGNAALFWVDELAVYAMVWMVLIGASVMVRERSGIAATIVVDMLGETARRILSVAVDLLILCFSLALLVLCWHWYDPPGVISSGFDLEAFSGNSFNFIYQEPTNTLGIKKYLVWLVVPWVSITLTVHSAANIIEKTTGILRDKRVA